MAVQEHFEGFDTAPDEQSKSAHKREAQGIRKLAEKIADLGDTAFSRLKFEEEDIKDAFKRARSLKKNSDERRRQLQFTAKLLRNYGHESLEQQVNSMGATAKEDPKAMRLEQLREYLIHSGIKGVNAMVELIPGIDRNKLRTLVKRAHDELSATIPDRPAARALYQYIKAEVNRAQVEIPDSMQRAKPKPVFPSGVVKPFPQYAPKAQAQSQLNPSQAPANPSQAQPANTAKDEAEDEFEDDLD